MINPWFIAGGVMFLVGLFEEVNIADKKTMTALTGPKEKKEKRAGTIINVAPTAVQSAKEPKAGKKPSAKVPDEPPTDG